MKLQTQTERWQCAITAFAMALDVSADELKQQVGHDGGAIVFPVLSEPACRRGHNVYELIRLAIEHGYAVTPVPLQPAVKSAGLYGEPVQEIIIGKQQENWEYFTRHIHSSTGVIECYGPRGYHMVAYDYGIVFDPRGYEFPYSREACEAKMLYTYCLWRVDRMTNDGILAHSAVHHTGK